MEAGDSPRGPQEGLIVRWYGSQPRKNRGRRALHFRNTSAFCPTPWRRTNNDGHFSRHVAGVRRHEIKSFCLVFLQRKCIFE